MQTVPASSSSSAAKFLLPLAGIACFGLIVFLIAVMIVLALIPTFAAKKDLQPSPNSLINYSFPLQGPISLTPSLTAPRKLTNLAPLAQALGISNYVSVTEGSVQTTPARRKRALQTIITLLLTPKRRPSCFTNACIRAYFQRLRDKINQTIVSNNIPIEIIYNGVGQNYIFSFISFTFPTTTGFLDFTDLGNTTDFVAVRSGLFNNQSTWSTGVVPYGNFTARIPVGINVTIVGTLFELNMTYCEINGTLALGENSTVFAFKYPPNIVVRSGGLLQDLTTSKVITLPPLTLITLHPGGTTSSPATSLQTGAPSARLFQPLTNTTTLVQSGPFTCGVLPERQLSNTKVTFIAVKTGNFTTGSVYLGGFAPTKVLCALVGGCAINVTRGVVLSTSDLNGELDMKVDQLGVEESAVLDLGTPGLPNGFIFLSPIELDIYGTLAYVNRVGPISIPPNSALNLFPTGRFNSTEPSISIQSYNPSNPSAISHTITLNSSLSGPIYFNILSDGSFINNTVGPIKPSDVTTTTTAMPSVSTGPMG